MIENITTLSKIPLLMVYFAFFSPKVKQIYYHISAQALLNSQPLSLCNTEENSLEV